MGGSLQHSEPRLKCNDDIYMNTRIIISHINRNQFGLINMLPQLYI